MSVVGSDFEKLKRYNLAEIYNPTPKAVTAPKAESEPEGDGDGDRGGAEGDE